MLKAAEFISPLQDKVRCRLSSKEKIALRER